MSSKDPDKEISDKLQNFKKVIGKYPASQSPDGGLMNARDYAEITSAQMELSLAISERQHEDTLNLGKVMEDVAKSSDAVLNLTSILIYLTFAIIFVSAINVLAVLLAASQLYTVYGLTYIVVIIVTLFVIGFVVKNIERKLPKPAKGQNGKSISLTSKISRFLSRRHALILFLIGIIFTSVGVGLLVSYAFQPIDTVQNRSSGIDWQWTDWDHIDQPLGGDVIVNLLLNVNNSNVDLLFISLIIQPHHVFKFAFISPFEVISKIDAYSQGNWTSQSVSGVGSTILYTLNNSTGFSQPATINANFYVNIPIRDEHGSFELFFPFAGRLSPQLTALLPKNSSDPNYFASPPVGSIRFSVDIPLKYYNPSTSPGYATVTPIVDNFQGRPYLQYQFIMSRPSTLSPVTISYSDSSEQDNGSFAQNFGTLFVSLGIPIIIGTSWKELRKAPNATA